MVECAGRKSSWRYLPLSNRLSLENLQHTKENQLQIHQSREEGLSLQKLLKAVLSSVSSMYFAKQLTNLILHTVLETEEAQTEAYDILLVFKDFTI